MSGYFGYSMSNRAVEAYESGEKPFTQWTKKEILFQISKMVRNGALKIDMGLLRKLNKSNLQGYGLYLSSWHHTSSYYNQTNFYSINTGWFEELTNETILELLEEQALEKEENKRKRAEEKEKQPVPSGPVYKKCSYLVWSGPRKRRRAKEHVEECRIEGKWAYTSHGKKRLSGSRFFVLDD